MEQKIRAVLFDMGGVVMEYGSSTKISNFYKIIQAKPLFKQRFEDYERGLITIYDVEPEHLAMFGIHGEDDFERAYPLNNLVVKNPYVDCAIQSLRRSGKYVLGLLTNNGFWSADRSRSVLIKDTADFDHVIESCKIGHRKPDAEFYEIALKKMELMPEECVFIDDLESSAVPRQISAPAPAPGSDFFNFRLRLRLRAPAFSNFGSGSSSGSGAPAPEPEQHCSRAIARALKQWAFKAFGSKIAISKAPCWNWRRNWARSCCEEKCS